MCEFKSLYFEDDGYVVLCKACGHFQLGFRSTMLTLSDLEFKVFCNRVKSQCSEAGCTVAENRKSIIIPTPSPGTAMLLTRFEARRLSEILEQAENELMALSLISLFNPQ